MAQLRHPLSGALYTLRGDGLVEVESNGVTGLFHPDGRFASGSLRHADMHLLQWLGGPRPEEHAAAHPFLGEGASAA